MKTLLKITATLFILVFCTTLNAQETGCISGDCENGKGTYIWEDGQKYIGEWKNDIANGKGELYINGFLHFKGKFKNGEGVYELSDEYKKIKENSGKWDININDAHCLSGNCKDGFGIASSSSIFIEESNTYRGYYKNWKKSGKGTLTIVSKISGKGNVKETSYKGEWKNNDKHGQGTEIKLDENKNEVEKYIGQWKENERDGQGELYKSGKLSYKGNFKKGVPFKTEGCIAGDCTNGYGVFVYPNNDKYIGYFKNGKKNGEGFQLDPKQGGFYIGGWKNDKESGLAKIYNTNNEIMFSGEFSNGNPVTPPTKSNEKTGCVFGSCENGFGHYKFENGDVYIGEFKNNQQHGEGTFAWKDDASKHIGFFEKGVQNGIGRYIDKNGKVIMQGVFVNAAYINGSKIEKKYTDKKKCLVGDCIDGYGIYIETFEPGWNDAFQDYVNTFEVRYEGFWKNGKKHGFGFQEDRMANKYVGQFNEDEATGKGVINFANGDVYSGGLDDGRMHGYGTMKYADGTSYSGQWDDGQKVD